MNCSWLTHFGLAVLCDGRVSCNCGDGFAERIIGDLGRNSLSEIWRGRLMNVLREGMRKDKLAPLCVGCLFIQDRPLESVKEFPDVLFLNPRRAAIYDAPNTSAWNSIPGPFGRERPHAGISMSSFEKLSRL